MRVTVKSNADVVTARQKGRALATQMGFSATESTLIVTAISELARNLVLYPKRGVITLSPVRKQGRLGLTILADDKGTGIVDITRAIQDGYSTSGRLGVGLPGTKRIMDEFEIISRAGEGTTVVATKWLRLAQKSRPD